MGASGALVYLCIRALVRFVLVLQSLFTAMQAI